MLENLQIPNQNWQEIDEDNIDNHWFKPFKDLTFIPEWATNDCVLNILELSFEFLISYKKELIAKFWWKWFYLILLESLKNSSSFSEIWFEIPKFHLIPTDFYHKKPKGIKEDNLNHNGSKLDQKMNIVFSPSQEKYLRKVFDSFKWVSYISVRSSADIENTWNLNYSWVFYSWFCSTTDFDRFKLEVQKVIASSSALEEDKVNMWIVVMEISWNEKSNWYYYPYWWWVMETSKYWDRTTVSAEPWIAKWITSWESTNPVCIDFDNNWNPIQWIVPEDTSQIVFAEVWFAINNEGIKSIYIYHLKIRLWNSRIMWLFREEFYKKLLYIWKKLEQIFWKINLDKTPWYSLTLEFSSTDWKTIQIIQLIETIDPFIRPIDMQYPDTENSEVLFQRENIISWLWYINKQNLRYYKCDCNDVRVVKKVTDMNWTRTAVKKYLELKLEELEEENNWNWYIIDLWFSPTFPYLDRNKYPWLKWIMIMSIDWNSHTSSHAYTMLRELWIPTIVYDDELEHRIKSWESVKVYLDWNNWGCVYI